MIVIDDDEEEEDEEEQFVEVSLPRRQQDALVGGKDVMNEGGVQVNTEEDEAELAKVCFRTVTAGDGAKLTRLVAHSSWTSNSLQSTNKSDNFNPFVLHSLPIVQPYTPKSNHIDNPSLMPPPSPPPPPPPLSHPTP